MPQQLIGHSCRIAATVDIERNTSGQEEIKVKVVGHIQLYGAKLPSYCSSLGGSSCSIKHDVEARRWSKYTQTKAIESDSLHLIQLGYLLLCSPAVIVDCIVVVFDDTIQDLTKPSSLASNVATKMYIRNKQLLLENIYWILWEFQLSSTHLFQNVFPKNIWVDALSSYGQSRAQAKMFNGITCGVASWKTFRRLTEYVGRKNVL